MNLLSNLRMAITSLQIYRVRSLLAMMGIVIGVAAVIAVVAIGEANRRRLEQEVERIGVDLFWLQPDYSRMAIASARRREQPTPVAVRTLGFQDWSALVSFCPAVKMTAPVKRLHATAVFRGKEYSFECVATSPEYAQVRGLQTLVGRFLHVHDHEVGNRVAVLEYSPASKNLFASGAILQERVWINDVPFSIVGVIANKTELGSNMSGGTLYLPLSALPHLGMESADFDVIYCQAQHRGELSTAMRQATETLRSRYEGQSLFVAENARNLFRSAENLTRMATWVAAGIAAIALVVGGIGIMNIMLVSVSERTREIGVQRAVGAKRHDIAIQFLAEAIALCLLGGGMGISAGYAAARMVAQSLQIESVFSLASAAIGVSFSFMIGVLAGFFPAYKAARLPPVEALHSE